MENAQVEVCCAGWQRRGPTVSSDGPALVLCDGRHFQCLFVLSEREEHFSLDGSVRQAAAGSDGIQVAEFHFLHRRHCTIWMLLQSGDLGWALWPGGGSAADVNSTGSVLGEGSEGADNPLPSGGCHHRFICTAVNDGDGFMCAVADDGTACLVDSDGKLLASRHVATLRRPTCIATLPHAWAILSSMPQSTCLLSVCDIHSLTVLATLDFGEQKVSRVISWGQPSYAAKEPLASTTLLAFADSPPRVISLHLGHDGLPLAFDAHPPFVCELPLMSPHTYVLCAEAFVATPAPLVACGLSDGTICMLRATARPEMFEVCGRHSLSDSQCAPLVSCGFTAWSQPSVGGQLALFAVTSSSQHRLWISRLAPPVAIAAGGQPSATAPVSDDIASLHISLDSDSCWTMCHDGADCVPDSLAAQLPAPPTRDLEALIAQTAQEIAALEWEATALDEVDEEEHPQPLPRPSALLALDVPSPPKITRLSREQFLNPRWVRAQRELVDPVEIARSYLDRACQPEQKPFQPYWVASDVTDALVTRQPLDSAVSLLSVDPLELHVKSLCQPW